MAWDKSEIIAMGLGGMVGLAFSLYLFNKAEDDNRPQGCHRNGPAIIQEHVLGHEQPEVYIVQDGTPYFSHIDGKSLADFVRECYQPEERPPEVVPVSP